MKVERSGNAFSPAHTTGDYIYLLGIKNTQRPLMPVSALFMGSTPIGEFVVEKMLISRDESVRDPSAINMMKIRVLSGQLNKHWLHCKIRSNSLVELATMANFTFRPTEFIEKKCMGTDKDPITETFADNMLKNAGLYLGYIELGMGINILAYQAQLNGRDQLIKDIITRVEEQYPEIELVAQQFIPDAPTFYKLIQRPVAQPLEGELMDKDEDTEEESDDVKLLQGEE